MCKVNLAQPRISTLMSKLRYISILIVSMLFSLATAHAQAPEGAIPDGYGAMGNYIPGQSAQTGLEGEDTQGQRAFDSVPRKPRKPLESFYFDDSLRATRIFAWNVDPLFNTIERQVIDTLINDFQIDYLYMEDGVGSASLGNVGAAVMPLNYFKRPSWQNFSFLEVWAPYILQPKDVLFYNSKMPYSRLSYQMSGQSRFEEQLFEFVLSHNISPSTSANFVYSSESTRGMYMNQSTLDRNLSVNIAHTGKRYAIHGGYIFNRGSIEENGGVKDDREILDTVSSSPDQVAVNLNDSRNYYNGNTFWYTQSYGIPLRAQSEDELTIQKIPSVYVGQSLNYTQFYKIYSAESDTALYDTYFINPDMTFDSMAQGRLDVNAFVQLQPYNRDGALGLISAGVGAEFDSYYGEVVPTQYNEEFGAGGKFSTNSTYIYGDLQGQVSKYLKWNAALKYYLTGHRSADMDLKGNISLSAYVKERPITLDASVKVALESPDVWEQNYFSNHYGWSNSFSKENIFATNAKLSIPSINLFAGFDYSLTTGKIYYDAQSLPAQYDDPLSVLAVYLQKDFKFGGLHLNHRLLAQVSSNQEVAPVPELSAYLSYYYQFFVTRNVLEMQIGVDAHYNTSYYGFGYNPALGKFYNQREKELGGYPYLDAFVNAKWKRMRIGLKLQHFNANMSNNRNYFQVLHYPQNRMMFKIGISWSFYD